MKCDFWASFLACIFASPCLGRKPKAKVATCNIKMMAKNKLWLMEDMQRHLFFAKGDQVEKASKKFKSVMHIT
jgi:hypothetical protein